ncbi:hypothetical protein [Sagittula sp. SSi028]|uniref:DUF7742 family protein n=1 Tax=Sagittula sp. SSi028 TaxID=3400636 RepID=UPI003AF47BCC
MRPVLPGDISAAVRALLSVPPPDRAALARRLVEQAALADSHRRRTGCAHPDFGDGTLMAAALPHATARERAMTDPECLDCMALLLHELSSHGGVGNNDLAAPITTSG